MATTSDYLNKLVEQRNDLATRLVDKGVEASTEETLETLIPKVSDIESGGSEVYFSPNGIMYQEVVNFPEDITVLGTTSGQKYYDGAENIKEFNAGGIRAIQPLTFQKSSIEKFKGLHLTTIGSNAFNDCANLHSIELGTDSKLTISGYAFYSCKKLTDIELPPIATINSDAFRNCLGLKTVKFTGSADTVGGGVFTLCTNITDIYVPWAEGAVAGAPWGATNATIHYNYTEESEV